MKALLTNVKFPLNSKKSLSILKFNKMNIFFKLNKLNLDKRLLKNMSLTNQPNIIISIQNGNNIII